MQLHRCPTSVSTRSASTALGAGQGCLTENSVLDLVTDAMARDSRQHADAHLLQCSECRRLVSEAVLALAPDVAPVAPPTGTVPIVLPQVGDIVEGKYQIDRVVGQGGMGVVFAAKHLMLDHPVALKFLWSPTALSEASKQRFLREGRAALRVESDHIARVMDVGITDQGAPFVVMELLQGKDVRSVLASEGPLPWREVVRIFLQALEAVGAAHDAGVVHRDLKPANLFLMQTHQERRVKVLDFGVSKITGDPASGSLTTTEAMLGSPAYMAPEQMEDASRVDARADVWSAGATMFEMLTGKPAFSGASVAALYRSIRESKGVSVRDHVPDVPRPIDAVVRRCLSVDPGDRYANGRALREALEAALSEGESGSWRGRSSWARGALGIVGAATTTVLVLLIAWSRPATPVVASPAAAAASSGVAPHTAPSAMSAAESTTAPDVSASSSTLPVASSIPRVLPAAPKRVGALPPTPSATAVRPPSGIDPDPHAPGLADRK
jgi:serine/threonine-protein kinase